jgi:hypothetical protein
VEIHGPLESGAVEEILNSARGFQVRTYIHTYVAGLPDFSWFNVPNSENLPIDRKVWGVGVGTLPPKEPNSPLGENALPLGSD